jgi:pSer/pThr/pTyr-binding forkhead associated (FHA) protein
MMNGQVICRTGFARGVTKSCAESTRIGRDEANELSIPHESLSRLHATISYSGGTYWIEDGGSTNGTFLNGRRVAKERLRAFDIISLGRDVDLIFLTGGVSDVSIGLRRGIVNALLVALDGPEQGTEREIPRGTLTVGRTTASNIQLDSVRISKMHARIERTADRLVVTDLGSANGTYVNGEPIVTSALETGDVVSFASTRQFRVELEYGMILASSSYVGLPALPSERPEEKTQLQILQETINWRLLYEFSPGEAESVQLKSRVTSYAPIPLEPVTAKSSIPPNVPPTLLAQVVPPPLDPPPSHVQAPPKMPRIEPIERVLLKGNPPLDVGWGTHVAGREVGCELVIPHTTVSRRHARLDVTAETVVLTDLGSANGTFVDGARLQGSRELKGGETATFGKLSFGVELVRARSA